MIPIEASQEMIRGAGLAKVAVRVKKQAMRLEQTHGHIWCLLILAYQESLAGGGGRFNAVNNYSLRSPPAQCV